MFSKRFNLMKSIVRIFYLIKGGTQLGSYFSHFIYYIFKTNLNLTKMYFIRINFFTKIFTAVQFVLIYRNL